MSDMPPVLVKLPHLSTGFLPSPDDYRFGYLTEMDDQGFLRAVLAWIDERKTALEMSDSEICKEANTPYAIQNIRKAVRNGYGSRPKEPTLRALAKVLGNAPAGLLVSSELTDLDRLKAHETDLEGRLGQVRAAIALIEERRRVG